jgi:exodeoxyribonuclease-3
MKIATWNVNSVRARHDRLLRWLAKEQPDVLCLQELKTVDSGFPTAEVQALGYHSELFGQPTYNGVAILSRAPITDVVRGFGDDEDDPQARFLCATVLGVRVISAYFPNGSEPDSEKYEYKQRWLTRLHAWLSRNASPDEPLALAGDYNIAPADRDARNPGAWRGSVLLNEAMTAAFQRLIDFGTEDCLARQFPEGGVFTWWDYRNLGFPKNDGLRIDHILATKPLARRFVRAWVDRDERKGEKPSDHAPVLAEFAD